MLPASAAVEWTHQTNMSTDPINSKDTHHVIIQHTSAWTLLEQEHALICLWFREVCFCGGFGNIWCGGFGNIWYVIEMMIACRCRRIAIVKSYS